MSMSGPNSMFDRTAVLAFVRRGRSTLALCCDSCLNSLEGRVRYVE